MEKESSADDAGLSDSELSFRGKLSWIRMIPERELSVMLSF